MAAYKFRKDSEERKMFVDFWEICQKYWLPENTDEYWENLIKDTDDFSEKNKSDFAGELIVWFVMYMEKQCKRLGGAE